jgi:hypothetical protein
MHDPESGLRRIPQLVEKLPWFTLSHHMGHEIRRFGTFSSPICGRYQLNVDFFNRLVSSRNLPSTVSANFAVTEFSEGRTLHGPGPLQQ